MAQAARLSLRMHKELKLLLTDPPPGASFPTLSDDHSFSSLTSIDALFQGPQGTVYANGVFKIKIQIPERYPFQPPVVTFATPIYHPNIDNGGRICLDILNLPPKGTWQPSLNISTVLTSIGLLLSEPNPDDGLMHEASREYKYNRQAFDQNSRSMTEKYARAGESETSGGSHGSQICAGPSTAQTGTEGSDASTCTELFVYHERFKGSSSKLSLESLQSSSNWKSGKEIYRDPGRLTKANSGPTKFNENPGKSQATRNKMCLAVSCSRNGISLPNQCSSMLDTKTTSNDTPESSPLVEVGSKVPNTDIERSSSISAGQEQQCCAKMGRRRDSDEKLQSVPKNEALSWSLCTSHNKTNPPKTDVIARKGSIGLRKKFLVEDEKENSSTPLKAVDEVLGSNNNAISYSDEKQQTNEFHDRGESTDKFKQLSEEGSQIPEAVIVLDSEDSEDENVHVRSKLSLTRRCLSRKRKGNLAASYR